MREGGGDGGLVRVQQVGAVGEGDHDEADHQEHAARDHARGLGHLHAAGLVEINPVEVRLDEHLPEPGDDVVGEQAPAHGHARHQGE